MQGTDLTPLHLRGVHIANFQSLQDVDLELGPITIITGDNSKGKSALVRALQAVAFNRAGADFITRWIVCAECGTRSFLPPDRVRQSIDDIEIACEKCAKEVRVKVHQEKDTSITFRMGTGQTVTWTKGQKGGASVDVDGDVITRAKNEWPPELAAIFGMRELELGTFKARLQFQDQFARPFMLGSATGGQAAAVLCSVSRIDKVVDAIGLARTDVREAERLATGLEAEAERLQAELDQLPDYAALLFRAEALQAAETENAAAVQRLDEARGLVATVTRHKAFTVRWMALDLPARTDALATAAAALAELAGLAATVRTRTPQTRIDVAGLHERIDTFLAGVTALGEVGAAVADVRRLRETEASAAGFLENARVAAVAADAAVEAALAEYVERGVCPTCGQELPRAN